MAGGKGPKIQALSAGLRNVRGRVDEESARLGVMVTQSAELRVQARASGYGEACEEGSFWADFRPLSSCHD